MARLLTDLGIMCGHESIFTSEGIDDAIEKLNKKKSIEISDVSKDKNSENWFDANLQIADSSYMAAPFLEHDCLSNCKIIHVVRNPIKVISSTYIDANFFDCPIQIPYIYFVYSHLPELKNIKNKIERTVAYYVWWNELIEKTCQFRIQVECIGQKLFDFLEIEKPEKIFDNNKINAWNKRKKDLTLNDIPNGSIKNEFIKKIEQYGYTKLY